MVQAFEESLVLLGRPNIRENIVPPTQQGTAASGPSSAPGGSAPQQAQADPPAQQAQLAWGLDENGHYTDPPEYRSLQVEYTLPPDQRFYSVFAYENLRRGVRLCLGTSMLLLRY